MVGAPFNHFFLTNHYDPKTYPRRELKRNRFPTGRPFVACDPRNFECSVSI
eukprot:COSAG02_NODE_1634_length_11565_cov_4.754666_5_plen_51_part_00